MIFFYEYKIIDLRVVSPPDEYFINQQLKVRENTKFRGHRVILMLSQVVIIDSY